MKLAYILATLLASNATFASSSFLDNDKSKHLVATTAIALGSSVVLQNYDLTNEQRFWTAASIGVGAGLVKEIADSQEKGNKFDEKDMLVNVLGSLLGAASFEVYDGWNTQLMVNNDAVGLSLGKQF